MQRFANNEVHFSVGGVGEEVEADRWPFWQVISDEADGLGDRLHFAAVVSRHRKRDFSIAFVKVPKNVNLVAMIVDETSFGRLELP